MTDFTATSSITIYGTLEEAVAGLETKLEAIVNTGVIRACDIVETGDHKFAAYVVWTAAV
jgi:hypothetical protein